MWVVVLIDFCLLINLLLMMTAIALAFRPGDVVRYASRLWGLENWWEEGDERQALAVARLWERWLWVLLFAWGLLTGFLIGLYWEGAFWRIGAMV